MVAQSSRKEKCEGPWYLAPAASFFLFRGGQIGKIGTHLH